MSAWRPASVGAKAASEASAASRKPLRRPNSCHDAEVTRERNGLGRGRRAVFPVDFVEKVENLPASERHRRLVDYIDRHGEDVPPGGGYGPKTPPSLDHPDPPG